MSNELLFLGFVINLIKVQAIRDRKKPTIITKVQSFHGLATFYRKFIKDFSTIASPFIDYLRKGKFKWGPRQDLSFATLKQNLSEAPILVLPDFDKLLKLESYDFKIGNAAMFTQKRKSIDFFCEKKM